MSILRGMLDMWELLAKLTFVLVAAAEAIHVLGVNPKCTCRRWAILYGALVASTWAAWLADPAGSGGLADAVITTMAGAAVFVIVRYWHRRGWHGCTHIRLWLHRDPGATS